MSNSVGEKLRTFRESKGFSLDELARLSGITRDHIGRIERGESENPRKRTLDALAKALEVHPHVLIYGDQEAPIDIAYPPRVAEAKVGYFAHEVPLIGFSHLNRAECFDTSGRPIESEWKKLYLEEYTGSPNLYALIADSQAAAPRIFKDDIVVVNPDLEVRNGDMAVVCANKGEFMLRNCVFYGRHVVLYSYNPVYEPLLFTREQLRFIHKVIRIHVS